MNKRYQVFVSSTYEDLVEERLEVMKALLELDCFPSGMEYFPAANEDQWTFIKNLINECDYYIVVIGGKYGSEDSEGISYTQKEYEYALSIGLPTIGFYHKDRDSLPDEKKEDDKEKIDKLDRFLAMITSKLCKDWTNAYELGAVVSRSLTQLIKNTPRTGWVRANKVGGEELLEEINTVRKENQALKDKIVELEENLSLNIDTENLAYDDAVTLSVIYNKKAYGKICEARREHLTSWRIIFKQISPYLLRWYNEETIGSTIASRIIQENNIDATSQKLDTDDLQLIKIQFLSLGLIHLQTASTVGGGTGLFWALTPKGKSTMLQECSIKKRTGTLLSR